MQPLVEKHYTWRHLLRELLNTPGLARMKDMSSHELKMRLWPVVSLARWIATEQPELIERNHLTLVIGGAETNDAADNGMWYTLMPLLLGRKSTLSISVHLVGLHYGEIPEEFKADFKQSVLASPWRKFLPNYATPHKMSLAQFYKTHSVEDIDAIMLFHPGFESHLDEWLSDDSLSLPVNAGVPVIASSYYNDEQTLDRILLEAYGFEAVGEAIDNPYRIESFNEQTFFSYDFWRIGSAVPLPLKIRDQDRFNRATVLSRLGSDSFNAGDYKVFSRMLERQIVTDNKGDQDLIIILPFDHFLRHKNGEILIPDNDSLILREGPVMEKKDIENCPAHNASPYEKMLYCAMVMIKYDINMDSLRASLARHHGAYQSKAGPTLSDLMGGNVLDELMSEDGLKSFADGYADFLSTTEDIDADSAQEISKQLIEMFGSEQKRVVPAEARGIIDAMHLKDFVSVRRIIADTPTLVDSEDENGVTPLYTAAVMNDPEMVNFLIKHGANPNHKDCEGWPIITEAARYQSNKALKSLMKAPHFDVNNANKLGWNGLLVALSVSNFEAFELLMAAGGNLDMENVAGLSARAMLLEHPEAPEHLRHKMAQRA